MSKHDLMKEYMTEWKAEKDAALAAIEDEDKLFIAKIQWELELHDRWQAKRRELFAKTEEEVRNECVGEKCWIFGFKRHSESKRVVREDENGFYVLSRGEKARVVWDGAVNGLKVTHWESK